MRIWGSSGVREYEAGTQVQGKQAGVIETRFASKKIVLIKKAQTSLDNVRSEYNLCSNAVGHRILPLLLLVG